MLKMNSENTKSRFCIYKTGVKGEVFNNFEC